MKILKIFPQFNPPIVPWKTLGLFILFLMAYEYVQQFRAVFGDPNI